MRLDLGPLLSRGKPMDDMKAYAKAEFLEAMYASVDRMNQHLVEGNTQSAEAERHLQMDLRKNFESLSD
jgi:hypothetical protein